MISFGIKILQILKFKSAISLDISGRKGNCFWFSFLKPIL